MLSWEVYDLQLEHLAPSWIPQLGIDVKDDRLILPSVRGDVTVRPRAFHPPGHADAHEPGGARGSERKLILRDSSETGPSGTTAFLYMDERYPDTNAPPEMQVTSLDWDSW